MVENNLPFMEFKDSLLASQKLASGSSPKPVQTGSHFQNLFP